MRSKSDIAPEQEGGRNQGKPEIHFRVKAEKRKGKLHDEVPKRPAKVKDAGATKIESGGTTFPPPLRKRRGKKTRCPPFVASELTLP